MLKSLQIARSFDIRSTETDVWDRIQLDALFSMMQEVASDHASVLGTDIGTLDARKVVFLLSQMSFRILEYPKWTDQIVIHTWCRDIIQLYFLRDFSIETADGKQIAAASSTWFLTDKNTHRPVRPSVIDDLTVDYTLPDQNALGFNAPRFKKGQLQFPEQANFYKFANFSDLDRNRHLNNTRYIAWLSDYYYHHTDLAEAGSITGIDINYLSEIKYRERVRLRGREVEDSPLLHKPEGSNALAVEGLTDDDKPAFRSVIYHLPYRK